MNEVSLGIKKIGGNNPSYIIAEIGLNHNGSLDIAKKLIDVAVLAGCDAVKFQKRNPEKCVPEKQRNVIRETPWGEMTYFEYRYKVEFQKKEFDEIDRYCKEKQIDWLASAWDEDSLDFLNSYDVNAHKVPSAALTNDSLLRKYNETNKVIILSTGMSNTNEIEHAISLLDQNRLILLHATSTYPCVPEELNLNIIPHYLSKYSFPIGYSGHEVGLQTTYAAVALGAKVVERHITLDRSMWGSDHAASIEPQGLIRLVRDIRIIEIAKGDGIKKVYESELPILKKLRFI